MKVLYLVIVMFIGCYSCSVWAADKPDFERDILVTFNNDEARSSSAGLGAPYQHRKQYSLARKARRDAAAVATEYSLKEINHWPIDSLSIYCFVYRLPEKADRQSVIAKLNADDRVESAQPLQSFDTSVSPRELYDDTHASLQYGLDVLEIAPAHSITRGAGVTVVIIDSQVDKNHEDLRGRVGNVREFSYKGMSKDERHGTAIASVIAARSNNALGMVGIAPEATLEVYASCWSSGDSRSAICDSFSLSKALDAVLDDPPDVLNLSLIGPHDPLLERLIQKAHDAGVIMVAASAGPQKNFPSSMQQVIAVGAMPIDNSIDRVPERTLQAPGNRILVATPADQYDFRSGSSLAAAHASGVIALLLSVAPDLSSESIETILRRSQVENAESIESINACDALNLAGIAQQCGR
jgi:subtilisin family serine protease